MNPTTIDALWRKEVEDRIQAYQDGKLQSVSLADVLAKYRSEQWAQRAVGREVR